MFGMPVSMWMIDNLGLQPGQRLLELAAGPGDTGFLAAELIQPGGTLISSDGSDAMLAIARDRAREFGLNNVEYLQLDLEWIALETASIDAVLCRWGLMLVVDREAAAREARRVLRPGGRLAVAVWDEPRWNPWATIPAGVLLERGHAEPPDPDGPGMFALAAPGRLSDLLDGAGFDDVVIDTVAVERRYSGIDSFLEETLDVSPTFGEVCARLDEDEQAAVRAAIEERAAPLAAPDGSLTLPGRCIVAAANA
jgi:SAM-dependent methyltransferase